MFSQLKSACFCLLFFYTLQAQSMSVFTLTALNKPAPVILGNSITHAQYRVTNNTKTARTLVMLPVTGIQQLLGSNLCSSPFLLTPGQSCLLDLELDASQMTSVSGGPVICKTKGPGDNTPDPFLCAQPGPEDQLEVSVKACLGTACLPAHTSAKLRAITEVFRKKYDIPGIVSGLWIPNRGDLILEEGFADLKTRRYINRLNHFRIGSVTKSFTVTVMLQLIQKTLLELTTPLSRFMPGLQNANATMADLADMRSGIFNYTEDQNFVSNFFNDLTRSRLPEELVAAGDANAPYFSAGTQGHYSNTNTVIIGMIIEMITQRSLAEEIQERILLPLKLKNTSYPYTLAMPSPYAHGYAFNPREDLTGTSPTSTAGSGAMISSLEDLHIWSQALGTGTLLAPGMFATRIASMQPVVYSPCPDNLGRGPVNCPEYNKYGLGIGELKGWIGHTGEFVGYSLLIMHQPDTGASIVILMNLSGAGEHLPVNLFKEYLAILNAP